MTKQILGNVFENYEEIDKQMEKEHMVEFGIQVMKIILHFHFILKQNVNHKNLKE